MPKRRLTNVSSDDYREKKTVPTTPILNPVHRSNQINFSGNTADEYDQEQCASSVGSNQPIGKVITLSDDDDGGEVASRPFKIDSLSILDKDVAGVKSQTGKSEIAGFRSMVDEQSNWFEKYGWMIVDDNGFLLGEFRRLDEELCINITKD